MPHIRQKLQQNLKKPRKNIVILPQFFTIVRAKGHALPAKHAFPMEQLIKITDISIAIGEKTILQHASLSANEGELVYIIGAVGSGKSSLLKTIYAEMDYEDGSVEVLGQSLDRIRRKHIPGLRRQMGIVFQDYALLCHQTIRQNLDFVLRATGWKRKAERKARIEEVLQQVELPQSIDCYPHELSGGEQQRIAIARAILNSPRLILADEPTGNLDATTANKIMTLLDSLRKTGTAVVIVTHNMKHPAEFPGRIYECHGGTVTERTATQADGGNSGKHQVHIIGQA